MKKLCLLLVLCLLLSGCSGAKPAETAAPTTSSSITAPDSQTPQKPADPTTPAAPSDPAQPTDPAQPSDPTESTQPDEPATPTQPADPTEPTVPAPVDPPKPSTPPEENTGSCSDHKDEGNDGKCDICGISVVVIVDFFNINDLHGKIADADTHPGVDELTTYFKSAKKNNDHVVFLSTGDMWQGSSESNLTQGLLTTDWMNHVGFSAMSLGNHEFDWGEDPIAENAELAKFPILAINVYSNATGKRVSYCKSSVMITRGDAKIGIIGAIGDCYSSISKDKVTGVNFKVGAALTNLVKNEATRLREQGADYIVYLLHDGFEQSRSGSTTTVANEQLKYYYDAVLSDGYVDLVFEGHTHQRYILKDEHGVYHLQNKGDNKGISHIEVGINTANGTNSVRYADLIATGTYATMADDPIVKELLDKYDEQVSTGTNELGTNARQRSSSEMAQLVADLYYQKGLDLWGKEYDIVLGGGFISVRSPYSLAKGEITYGMLYSLFPFDNDLVLCSIQGKDLKSRFFETDNDRYYLGYGDYGAQVKRNIDPNKTYYIVVDSYTSVYAPNNLTEVERYAEKYYARDMLADYAKDGGFKK